MRDMYADHEEVARPDARRLTAAIRAVERTKLANDIVVANLEKAFFACELNVLRLATDDGVFVDAIPRAQPRKSLDHSIGADLAIRPNLHVIFNNRGRMYTHLQGFEDNRVLWILQILFIMLGCL